MRVVAKDVSWKSKEVTEIKQLIKTELRNIELEQGNRVKLHTAVTKAHHYRGSECSRDQLKLFVYALSSLYHHANHGGLRENQINSLIKLSKSVLKLNGIDATKTKLSQLERELKLIVGQIHRREGNHWLAANQHHLAELSAKKSDHSEKGQHLVSIANRCLRLGLTALAIEHYQQARGYRLPRSYQENSLLGELKAYRLSGRYDQYYSLYQKIADHNELSETGATELLWENFCVEELILKKNYHKLLRLRKCDSFVGNINYLLEMKLWIFAFGDECVAKRFTKTNTMINGNGAELKSNRGLYKVMGLVDNCYDSDFSKPSKIEKSIKAFSLKHTVNTLEKEMLVLAALAKVFKRLRMYNFTKLALHEYRGLALKVSAGLSQDTFNLINESEKSKTSPHIAILEPSRRMSK